MCVLYNYLKNWKDNLKTFHRENIMSRWHNYCVLSSFWDTSNCCFFTNLPENKKTCLTIHSMGYHACNNESEEHDKKMKLAKSPVNVDENILSKILLNLKQQ